MSMKPTSWRYLAQEKVLSSSRCRHRSFSTWIVVSLIWTMFTPGVLTLRSLVTSVLLWYARRQGHKRSSGPRYVSATMARFM